MTAIGDDTTAQDSEGDFVDIVFDGPPDFEGGRFIEVENRKGESIKFGRWLQRPDGYWVLRVGQPVNRAVTTSRLADRVNLSIGVVLENGTQPPYRLTAHEIDLVIEALRADEARASSTPSEDEIARAICEAAGWSWAESECADLNSGFRKCARAVLALLDKSPDCNANWNRLVEYMQWLMREGAWEGHDMAGDELQNMAQALGIIVETRYDPAIHGESNCGAEPGDEWFVFADWLKPVQTSG